MAAKSGSRLLALGWVTGLLFLAVPVWWQTTRIHRAPLPFELLPEPKGNGQSLELQVKIAIATELIHGSKDTFLNQFHAWLQPSLSALVLPEDAVSISLLCEEFNSEQIKDLDRLSDHQLDLVLDKEVTGEAYTLFLLPGQGTASHKQLQGEEAVGSKEGQAMEHGTLTQGQRMHSWLFVPLEQAKSFPSIKLWAKEVPQGLGAVILGERQPDVKSVIMSGRFLEQSKVKSEIWDQLTHPSLRLSFSLLLAEGTAQPVHWGIQQATKRLLQPLKNRLQGVFNLTIDSQVLYYARLAIPPQYSADLKCFTLASETLNDFINSKEWYIDGTTSNVKTLNFLLYVPSPEYQPLKILDTQGVALEESAFSIEGYGGVYIMNEGVESIYEDLNPSIPAERLLKPMQAFVGQFRHILGLDLRTGVRVVPEIVSGIGEWQLHLLQRKMTRHRLVTARNSLKSFQSLVDSIPVMVIKDEIGTAVQEAIHHVTESEESWRNGNLLPAAVAAASAAEASENAFFHSSILSMLYFPDDHKAAVYIPYFVPVLLPVLAAVFREAKILIKGKK